MKNKTYNLEELLMQINQKKKELKLLNEKFKASFDAVAKSWKEEINAQFPQLQPCNIGEYVGVDVNLNGQSYNIFISESRQKLYCMFSLDQKNHENFTMNIRKIMDDPDFEKLKDVFNNYISEHKKRVGSDSQGFFVNFRKEDYQEAFNFFLEVVKVFA